MLDDLASVIGGLITVDVNNLSAECLQESVVEFRKLTSLLAAAEARFVDRWDGDTVWAGDGSRSAGNRLARDAHCNPAVAGAIVKRARRLRTMPVTAVAFQSGEISVDHVDVLTSVNREPYEKRFGEGEEHLVGVAKQRWFDNFTRTVKYWKQAADDDVSEKDAQQRYDERYFKARPTLGDMTDLQGRLDPVNGAIFSGELARLERIMFEADWAAAKAVHGLDTSLGHLARTTGQRNADALVEMARRSAAKEPGAVKARTLLTILVGYETFAGRVCEMANGTVVTPGQVANLFHHRDGTPIDTIDVERVVFDGPSRVIDVGVRTRGYIGGLRRAIEVRDRHCTFAGCMVPAQFCHIDHIIEYCDGGWTTQDNGRLRCPAHNHQRPGRRRAPPTTGP